MAVESEHEHAANTKRCETSVLPSPLDLLGVLLRACRTQPVAYRFLLNAHALPMEPLILALVVVARDHIAETDALAEAILRVVRFLFVCVACNTRHVLIFRARLTCYALVVRRR
jgi:hypothetical protein